MKSMIEDDAKDKKEDRRKHIKNKHLLDKKDIFLENNRINISKLEIEEEELWDDWEIEHK